MANITNYPHNKKKSYYDWRDSVVTKQCTVVVYYYYSYYYSYAVVLIMYAQQHKIPHSVRV